MELDDYSGPSLHGSTSEEVYNETPSIVQKPYDPSLKTYIREAAPGENLEGLCAVCNSINFPEIDAIDPDSFDLHGEDPWRLPVFHLPNIEALPKNLYGLCEILHLLRGYCGHSEDNADYSLILNGLKGGLPTSLAVEPKALENRYKLHSTRRYPTAYYMPSDSTKTLAQAQNLRRVNFDGLLSQLQAYKDQYGFDQLPHDVPVLRLIDCSQMTVVHAPDIVENLALSYVWGKGTSTIGDKDYASQSLALETLPRTIADAIQVTLGLKRKYLWVDC